MYNLHVKGIDGHFSAELTCGSVHVDSEDGFSSVKSAEKWADSRARLHAEIARPSELVSHHKQFTV